MLTQQSLCLLRTHLMHHTPIIATTALSDSDSDDSSFLRQGKKTQICEQKRGQKNSKRKKSREEGQSVNVGQKASTEIRREIEKLQFLIPLLAAALFKMSQGMCNSF